MGAVCKWCCTRLVQDRIRVETSIGVLHPAAFARDARGGRMTHLVCTATITTVRRLARLNRAVGFGVPARASGPARIDGLAGQTDKPSLNIGKTQGEAPRGWLRSG